MLGIGLCFLASCLSWLDFGSVCLHTWERVFDMIRLLIVLAVAYMIGARWPGLAQKIGVA